MSSVGSLSSSTSSSIFNSSKRITGLASGLDTDALVESMTAATRSKIAKQNQQKQLLQWKMEDYRSISSKLIAFQNKYTSYSSSTNLRGPSFFGENLLSVIGENSKYVSVSGNSSNVKNLTIAAVKQLAKNNSYVSNNNVSDQKLEGSNIKGDEVFTSSKLEGDYISFSYGSSTYTLSLSAGKEYGTADEVITELNDKLSQTKYDDSGKTLADVLEFSKDSNGRVTLGYKKDASGSTDQDIKIKSGSEDLMNALGFEEGFTATKDTPITGKTELTEDILKGYQTSKTFEEMVSGEGKTLSFTYNGVTKTISLPGKDSDLFDEKGNVKDMNDMAKYLETELSKAFGSGRIDVSYNSDGKLEFKTIKAGTASETDEYSVLKINTGDANALKALGLTAGDSNRLNLNKSLTESGLNANNGNYTLKKEDNRNDYVINIKNNTTGETITIDKTVGGVAFDENTSISDIIQAINASDAQVKVSYLETSDKFTLESTDPGASGNFSIVGGYVDENGDVVEDASSYNLGEAIFGKDLDDGSYTHTHGQDAVIVVDYDGEGGADPVEISRSTNTFNIDGLSVTVSGVFGMKDGSVDPDAAVTFGAKVDTEKVTETIKQMIEDFNEIIKLTNDEVSEKRNRDYEPLTDEQKEEMTEDQIKNWEEKAKAGMLFNDFDLKEFTSSIRFIFSGDSETMKQLSDMGITTSTNYEDHGKITFDESKFKAALEADPDAVADLFTRTEKTIVDSNGKEVTQKAGIMNQIKDVFDKYASTTGSTKGIFVQMAGAEESPLSMLDNYLLDRMDDIDEEIERLQDKLENETERYYSQFTSLETFISQMNSQSSWLSSQFA